MLNVTALFPVPPPKEPTISIFVPYSWVNAGLFLWASEMQQVVNIVLRTLSHPRWNSNGCNMGVTSHTNMHVCFKFVSTTLHKYPSRCYQSLLHRISRIGNFQTFEKSYRCSLRTNKFEDAQQTMSTSKSCVSNSTKPDFNIEPCPNVEMFQIVFFLRTKAQSTTYSKVA